MPFLAEIRHICILILIQLKFSALIIILSQNPLKPKPNKRDTLLRKPEPGDAYSIYRLIKQSPPLDPNSIYSYHLLCHHYRDTCIVAEKNGEIVGFISAYLVPGRPQTLFVWQVVVDASLRGKGLARVMLNSLLAGGACKDVRQLEVTVNPSNQASRRLFDAFAQLKECELKESIFMQAEDFGGEEHEQEILLSIGPFSA
jgi:L-2,4-diaminobutyric acid acetyltransferase